MTVTSRVSTLVRRSSLYLLLVLGAAACSSGHRIMVKEAQRICLSDEGTVRACLVPDKGDETTANIPIGNTGCYWFRLKGDADQNRKEKQFRRVATGRPRQFTFLVVNQCKAAVDVRFDMATTGSLGFLPGSCSPAGDSHPPAPAEASQQAKSPSRPAVQYRELHKGAIAAGSDVDVQCHTLPYRKKTFGGKTLERTFNLVATGYDGKPIPEVPFDPEVGLEKAGDP